MSKTLINPNEGYVVTLSLDGQRLNKSQDFKFNHADYDDYIQRIIKETVKFNALNTNTLKSDQITRFNAGEINFLTEQLTVSLGEAIKTWYPSNTARIIFPFKKTPAPGAQSLRYAEETWAGRAKVASDSNTTMPIVSVGKSFTWQNVFEPQLKAEYTLQELEAATLGTEPLESRRIMATKEGHERAINDIAFGVTPQAEDPIAYTMPGLFNQPDKCILASDDSSIANWNILTSNATTNRDNLLAVIHAPHNFTQNALSIPDTLVMPIAQVNKIMTQALSADNNNTVAKYILDNTSITRIVASPECKNVGKNSITDALFCLNTSEQSRVCEFQETLSYTPYPSQIKDFTFSIPTRSRNAGLFIFKKAIALVKNCGG